MTERSSSIHKPFVSGASQCLIIIIELTQGLPPLYSKLLSRQQNGLGNDAHQRLDL